jgi:acetyl esterase/lipase
MVTVINDHSMDIYVPESNVNKPDKGYPVIVYIVGGGWSVGNKSKGSHVCENLAKEGFLCVSPEYRRSYVSNESIHYFTLLVSVTMLALIISAENSREKIFITMMLLVFLSLIVVFSYIPRPKIQHPDHILDIVKSYKWINENIHLHGGNPKNVFLVGHSAGAHLASLLVSNSSYLLSEGMTNEHIKGCVAISGVYSDKRMQESPIEKHLLWNVFGKKNSYVDAFPIYSVDENSPPFLLLNAGYDWNLKKHTMDFHYTLRQRGVYVETCYFDDLNHFSIVKQWDDQNMTVKHKIVNFLKSIHAQ